MSRDDGTVDETAWSQIERLWREGVESPRAIGARFDVSHQKISAMARRHGWGPRGSQPRDGVREPVGAATLTRPERSPATTPRASARGERSRRAIIERLFGAVDTKLRAIERRIADGGDAAPADSERTTRSLNTLIRTLDKLEQYERQLGKQAAAKLGKQGGAHDDPERRREELARRIERLLQRR